ncbi:MAG: Tat pathway signal protein [Amaricoccus sp.]
MPSRRTLVVGGAIVAGAAAIGGLRWRQGGAAYARGIAESRSPLPPAPELRDLVRFATLAANGHNTQPWRFSGTASGVAIAPDLSRRTPIVDPDDHHLFVSLGCAAENLSLATRAGGRDGTPVVGDGGIEVDLAPGTAETGPLIDAIPLRQCTRADYDGSPIEPALVERLRAAAAMHQTEAIFVSAPDAVNDVLDLVLAGNAAQIGDPAFVQELLDWLRFSPAAAARHGDGLFAGSSGSPELPDWAGRLIFRRVFTVARNRPLCSPDPLVLRPVDPRRPERRPGRMDARRPCLPAALPARHRRGPEVRVPQPGGRGPDGPRGLASPPWPRRPPARPRPPPRARRSLPFSPRRPVEAVLA